MTSLGVSWKCQATPHSHPWGSREAGSGAKCLNSFVSPLSGTQGLRGRNPAQEAWTPVQESQKPRSPYQPPPQFSHLWNRGMPPCTWE